MKKISPNFAITFIIIVVVIATIGVIVVRNLTTTSTPGLMQGTNPVATATSGDQNE